MITTHIGSIIMGSYCSTLSDQYGPRGIATFWNGSFDNRLPDMHNIPYNFDYMELGVALFLMGARTWNIQSSKPNRHNELGTGTR